MAALGVHTTIPPLLSIPGFNYGVGFACLHNIHHGLMEIQLQNVLRCKQREVGGVGAQWKAQERMLDKWFIESTKFFNFDNSSFEKWILPPVRVILKASPM